MSNSTTSDHQHASELLKGQHDDADQGCITTLMCLKGNICYGGDIKRREKKTESYSAIEHSSKTEGNQ